MSEPKSSSHPPPAKITEVKFDPMQSEDGFWEDKERARSAKQLSFSGRMFNVGWKGWVRLALICIAVGAIFQAGGFNPFAPDFTIGAGFGQILNGMINIASWAAQLGALPLVLGALVVLPFWIVWRALVALLKRDKGPSADDRILPKPREGKQGGKRGPDVR